MITSAILFLTLASTPSPNTNRDSTIKEIGVSKIVQAMIGRDKEPENINYSIQVKTDDAADKEKFCALIKSEIELTCAPSKPSVAKVNGKTHDTPQKLITLIEKIETEFSRKGKWEAKVHTGITQQSLTMEVDFARQTVNSESKETNAK